MKRYHDESLPLKCNKCTYRFTSEARLKTHEFKEHIEKSLDVVEEDIARHLSEAKREGVNMICVECGEAFSSEKLLIDHIKLAHRPTGSSSTAQISHGSFPCEFCATTFTMRHNLMRHYRRVHNNELKYECKICKVKFKTIQYLYRHEVRSHEREEESIENRATTMSGERGEEICRICKQNFNGSKYRYERHMILMHEETYERILQCDICSKKFIFMRSLKFHMDIHRKRAREEKLPFKCGQCCRGFIEEEKLANHL